MGLIKAAAAAASGVFADEWKEYFKCDSLPKDVLMRKGRKTSPSNNKGNDDIISNGSKIDVADGQAALIIEDGKIIEFTAEPGSFIWDTSSEPSCFTGGFFKGMLDSFKRIGGRFTYGGSPDKTQRVYYFNLKEITDNKFGTPTPVIYDDPFYRSAIYIRYYGQFSLRICDPVLFYTSVAGNVSDEYTKDNLISIIRDEFMTALDTALAECSLQGIKFSRLPLKQKELSDLLKEALSTEWKERRGLEIVSCALAKITPDEKSRARIEEYDTNVMHSDKSAMAGGLAYAQMDALKKAAANTSGSISPLMAMGMINNQANSATGASVLLNNANSGQKTSSWICPNCGKENEGKFCSECGKRPENADGTWVCPDCGRENEGNFCSACGRKK